MCNQGAKKQIDSSSMRKKSTAQKKNSQCKWAFDMFQLFLACRRWVSNRAVALVPENSQTSAKGWNHSFAFSSGLVWMIFNINIEIICSLHFHPFANCFPISSILALLTLEVSHLMPRWHDSPWHFRPSSNISIRKVLTINVHIGPSGWR